MVVNISVSPVVKSQSQEILDSTRLTESIRPKISRR